MAAGVTIYRPETCVIDPEVEVAAGTLLEPFTQLLGRTRVGAVCRIRSFSVIENCTLGDGVQILQSCVLEDSVIANGARIRPSLICVPATKSVKTPTSATSSK